MDEDEVKGSAHKLNTKPDGSEYDEFDGIDSERDADARVKAVASSVQKQKTIFE